MFIKYDAVGSRTIALSQL